MPLKHLPQSEQPYKHIIEERAEELLAKFPLTENVVPTYAVGVRDALLWVLGFAPEPVLAADASEPEPAANEAGQDSDASGAVPSITVGDVVRLKSNPDQAMTVERVVSKGRLYCVWQDGNGEPGQGRYTPEELEFVSRP